MKIAIVAAAVLSLGATPAIAGKSPCAEEGYRSASNVARAGVQRLAPPVPGAKAAVGKFYDGSQCLSVRGGKKIREAARNWRERKEAN